MLFSNATANYHLTNVLGKSQLRVLSIPYFIFKGSLVDPRLRASNEHILIVRVPRAGGRPGYLAPLFQHPD
jgi:hypothetical protein